MHPVIYPRRRELAEYCRKNGILLQAYGSVLAGSPALGDPALAALAEARGCSPAQVLLAWGLGRGFQVIPKTLSPQRLRENQDSMDLSLAEEEMRGLEEAMSSSVGDPRVYWNPVDEAPVDLGDTGSHPHLDGPVWAPAAAVGS